MGKSNHIYRRKYKSGNKYVFIYFTTKNSENVKGYPCPPYKIIILDEADSMTDKKVSICFPPKIFLVNSFT